MDWRPRNRDSYANHLKINTKLFSLSFTARPFLFRFCLWNAIMEFVGIVYYAIIDVKCLRRWHLFIDKMQMNTRTRVKEQMIRMPMFCILYCLINYEWTAECGIVWQIWKSLCRFYCLTFVTAALDALYNVLRSAHFNGFIELAAAATCSCWHLKCFDIFLFCSYVIDL